MNPVPHRTIRARTLRKTQTATEYKLWYHIRNRQLGGIKFRRQQPVGPYTVDFISFESKLIIEIDGGQHNQKDAIKFDTIRTQFLEKQGYKVIRFWNNEILDNINGALEVIRNSIQPHPNPLQTGEGIV